jgi:hypothetical protein
MTKRHLLAAMVAVVMAISLTASAYIAREEANAAIPAEDATVEVSGHAVVGSLLETVLKVSINGPEGP